MKNSNATIGNRTHELSVSNAVPQQQRQRVPHFHDKFGDYFTQADKFCFFGSYCSMDNGDKAAEAWKWKTNNDPAPTESTS